MVLTIRFLNVCGDVSNGIRWVYERIRTGFETITAFFLNKFALPFKFDRTQTYCPYVYRPMKVSAEYLLEDFCKSIADNPSTIITITQYWSIEERRERSSIITITQYCSIEERGEGSTLGGVQ